MRGFSVEVPVSKLELKMYEERIAHHLFVLHNRVDDLSKTMDKIAKSLDKIAKSMEKAEASNVLNEDANDKAQV
jgi:hypothetical protein